jgi:hypothetical protein
MAENELNELADLLAELEQTLLSLKATKDPERTGQLLVPFTVPYTITSPAMMSAVNFAVAPTVTFRSSSWTSPSTVPSMYGSSLPEISPFTCKLDPSRAVAHPLSLSLDA